MTQQLRLLRILVLFVVALVSCGVSYATTLTPDGYVRLLDSTKSALTRVLDAEKAHPGAGIKSMPKVPSDVKVLTKNGETLDIDFSWASQEMSGIKYDISKNRTKRISNLIARFESLKSVDVPSNTDPGSVARSKTILKDILSRNEYKPSWFDKMRQKIMEFIFGLLGKLHVGKSTGEAIGWTIFVLAVVALVGILVFLVMRAIEYFGNRDRDPDAPYKKVMPKEQIIRSPEALFRESERLAAGGDYREAFRYLYLSSIMLLDHSKLVKYTEGVTNWEYLNTLRRQPKPELTSSFRDLTMMFDKLIYGKRDVSKEDFGLCIECYRSMEGMI